MPSYQVEGTRKEPGEIKDLALTLKDWSNSVSIYKSTTKKKTHTEPATTARGGMAKWLGSGPGVHILYHLIAA